MAVRILIADDHGVLRAGLHALIDGTSDMQVVAEAGNGEEALRLAGELRPDVILLDISMPDIDGIEVTRRLHGTLPASQVLILTMHEDTAMLREALRAGAAGYVIKRAVGSDLLSAIRAVRQGELYIHSMLTRDLFVDLSNPPARNRATEPLSAREVEVLRLIAEGYTNRQIADSLILSIRTIESHRASIMDKLNLHSRAELARYANEIGVLQPHR